MLNAILLQAAGAGISNIVMIVLLIAVFYFFMIRPQQKRQNEIKKFREALKSGDKIVTAGGIHGRIRKVDETTFQVEITKDVCITVDKGSVYPSSSDAQQAQQAAK